MDTSDDMTSNYPIETYMKLISNPKQAELDNGHISRPSFCSRIRSQIFSSKQASLLYLFIYFLIFKKANCLDTNKLKKKLKKLQELINKGIKIFKSVDKTSCG